MSEWLKEHAWKACVGETLPRVRIPLSPPNFAPLRLAERAVFRPPRHLRLRRSWRLGSNPSSDASRFARRESRHLAPQPAFLKSVRRIDRLAACNPDARSVGRSDALSTSRRMSVLARPPTCNRDKSRRSSQRGNVSGDACECCRQVSRPPVDEPVDVGPIDSNSLRPSLKVRAKRLRESNCLGSRQILSRCLQCPFECSGVATQHAPMV
jgi:hypothetical protein